MCTIYDASGRVVKTLVSGLQAAGTHELLWNIRDDSGKKVKAGVYFIRIENEQEHCKAKLIIVK